MMARQQSDGHFAANGQTYPYRHGIATYAVCEAYGMTRDHPDELTTRIGRAARLAVAFIERAQNESTGGWRYLPGQEGDTSVLGWQVEALHSAKLAGLTVDPASLEGAGKWLKSVAQGDRGGKSSYVPGSRPSLSMTAVGLLSRQYLGAKREDPALT